MSKSPTNSRLSPLHSHTEMSILDGASNVDDYVKWCVENGASGLGITDHGMVIAAKELIEKATKAGITPLPGCEFYIAPDKGYQFAKKAYDYYHLTVFAVNEKGYRNLLKLASKAWDQDKLSGFEKDKKTGIYKPAEKNRVISYYGGKQIKPRITFDELLENNEGLVLGSGCLIGALNKAFLNGEFKGAERNLMRLLEVYKDRMFMEIMPHDCSMNYNRESKRFEKNECTDWAPDGDVQKAANLEIIKMAKAHKLPLLMTIDSHFTTPDKKKVQDILLSNGDPDGWTFYNSYHMITTEDAWKHWVYTHGDDVEQRKIFTEAVENNDVLVGMAKGFKITDSFQQPTPDIPIEIRLKAETQADALKGLLFKQIDYHGRMDWDNEQYVERLMRELKVICDNGVADFGNYFGSLEDWCRWASENSILSAPGRGSGAGSFLCYLLKITHLNPFKYGLPFERFLSDARIKRNKFPDIDWDMGNRDLLVAYLRQRYGDRMAQASTLHTLKVKSAIKDACRSILGWNSQDARVDAVTKLLPKTEPMGISSKDLLLGYKDQDGAFHDGWILQYPPLDTFFKEYPQIYECVMALLGIPRAISRHASAYLISDRPISESAPTCTISGYVCTQYNASAAFNSVEKSGLIKFDFLRVNTLDDISTCIRMVQQRFGYKVWDEEVEFAGEKFTITRGSIPIEKLPIDDKGTLLDVYDLPEDAEVFKALSAGRTETVFQMNSALMTGQTKQIKPNSIMDLSDIVALVRPGPLTADTGIDISKLDQNNKNVSRKWPNGDAKTTYTMTELYISARHGKVPVSYAHPGMEPILKDTYGVACLPMGSILNSETGPITIESVKPGDKLLTSDGSKIWAGEVEKMWETGAKDLLKITLASGTEIISSTDHRFLTVDGDAMAKNLNGGSGKSWQDSSVVYEKWPQSTNEIELKNNEAYLIGLLVSDGRLTTSTVCVTTGSEKAAEYVSKMLSETWGGRASYYFNTRAWYASSVQTGSVRNLSFVPQALDRIYGGRSWKVKSASKRLPGNILRYSEKDRIDFLRGLWDGDGTYLGAVYYRSISPVLIDQVSNLLGSLKISFVKRKNSVQIIDTARFISFLNHPTLPNNRVKDGFDRYLPMPANKMVEWAKALKNKDNPKIKAFKGNIAKAGDLGGLTAMKIIGFQPWEDKYKELYEELYLGDARPVTVMSIESAGQEKCFDIQMKDQSNPYFLCNGVVVHNCYQEQLQTMFSDLAGYSPEEADAMREMLAKKKKSEVEKAIPELRRRLKERAWNDHQIDVFVSLCIASSAYSFNRAHSASYGMVAYMSAYLKTKFPLEWWTSVLRGSSTEDIREKGYAKVLLKDGILRLPDINGPTDNFTLINGIVYAPLKLIEKCGGAASAEIKLAQAAGPFTSFENFYQRVNGRGVNEGVVHNLIFCGAFDSIEPGKLPADLVADYQYFKRVHSLKAGKTNFRKAMIDGVETVLFDYKTGQALLDAVTEQKVKDASQGKLPSVPEMYLSPLQIEILRVKALPIYKADVHDYFKNVMAKKGIIYDENGLATLRVNNTALTVFKSIAEIEGVYVPKSGILGVWAGFLQSTSPFSYKDKKTGETVTALKLYISNDGDTIECVLWPNLYAEVKEPDANRIIFVVGTIKEAFEPGKWSMSVAQINYA